MKLTEKQLLIKFLKKNKLYIRFKNNTLKCNSYNAYKKDCNNPTFIKYINSTNPNIASCFVWSDTIQGKDFWLSINSKFRQYRNEYYER